MLFTGKRDVDWPTRLTRYVRRTSQLACAVGQNDCVVWSLGAVDAMCGTDVAGAVRGEFSDPDSAQAYLAERGWATLHDACVAYFGEPLQTGAKGQQGDIVVIQANAKYPIGVMTVLIGQGLLTPGPNGLVQLPFTAALMMGVDVFKTGR